MILGLIYDLLLISVMIVAFYKKATNLLEVLFDKVLKLLDARVQFFKKKMSASNCLL